ncbi:hypothetical protein ACQCSX_08580 [Pseudarthrobacter sp. P1]|uniref:hypothetical protein n=1 Tax=Pseudarthrobacter sp. P1 TaxID=3418418 RepID=UPI003CF4DA6A
MAAAKKTAQKKPSSTPSSGISVRALAIRRSVEALTPDFVAWFNQDGDDTAAALAVLGEVATVAGVLVDAGYETTALAFEADPLLDAADAVMAEEPDDEQASFTLTALRIYIEFLEETGRWAGSDEALGDVQAMLFMGAQDRMGGFTFDLPELSEEAELAGLAGTELVRSAEAILAWLGTGTPIGPGERPLPVDHGGMVQAAGSGHAEAIWNALLELELVAVDADTAAPAPAAQTFLSGGTEDRLVEVRGLASLAMVELVEESPSELENREVAESITVGVLSLATSAEPLAVEQVLDRADSEAEDADVAGFVQQTLESLQTLGLLRMDGHVVMEPFAVRALAEAFSGDYA